MNKKDLYESIMNNVAKEVKKTLNESLYGNNDYEEVESLIDMYFKDSIQTFAESFCNIWDDGELNVDIHDAARIAGEILTKQINIALMDEWEENH